MFPIRDHNPSERTPYVVWALIAANVLIFFSYWGNLDDPYLMGGFFKDWAMTPIMVSDGARSYTLVSHMFLHGGFMHLAGNMLFLWIFGDNLEDELGHIGFLLFYLAAGVGAGLIQTYADPVSRIPVVGASGAIAGVMGGYLLLFPRAKVDILLIIIIFFKIFPVPAWLMLAVWFGLQLLNGVLQNSGAAGVAYWAHAGGFIVGLVLMYIPWRRRGGGGFWRQTEGHPDHPGSAIWSPNPKFHSEIRTAQMTLSNPVTLTCHCGAVELSVDLLDGLNTVGRCDCSFCRRRGAAAATVPLDGLRIVKGADDLTLYQWGTKTARHYFCKTCGIYTHHRRRSNPNEFGVNVGALRGVNPRDLGEIGWSDGVNHPSDR